MASLRRLDRAAREYRAIIGPPDPMGPRTTKKAGGEGREDSGHPAGYAAVDGQPAPGSLGETLEQSLEQAREGQLEQLDADLDLQQVLADATAHPQQGSSSRQGRGTGLPTGRMPDRGVDRPAAPDEIQHARRYATRLRQALAHGTRRIDKRTPGGFDGRAYTRGQAQRQTGRPVSTHPWRYTGRSRRRSRSRTSGW